MYRSAILFKKQPLGQTPEKKKAKLSCFQSSLLSMTSWFYNKNVKYAFSGVFHLIQYF